MLSNAATDFLRGFRYFSCCFHILLSSEGSRYKFWINLWKMSERIFMVSSSNKDVFILPLHLRIKAILFPRFTLLLRMLFRSTTSIQLFIDFATQWTVAQHRFVNGLFIYAITRQSDSEGIVHRFPFIEAHLFVAIRLLCHCVLRADEIRKNFEDSSHIDIYRLRVLQHFKGVLHMWSIPVNVPWTSCSWRSARHFVNCTLSTLILVQLHPRTVLSAGLYGGTLR